MFLKAETLLDTRSNAMGCDRNHVALCMAARDGLSHANYLYIVNHDRRDTTHHLANQRITTLAHCVHYHESVRFAYSENASGLRSESDLPVE